MTNKEDIQAIIKHTKDIAPQDRTSVKLGAIIRILSILEALSEYPINTQSDKEVIRLSRIIQQLTKEHSRLIAIIRKQDKEILRLSNIIKIRENEAKNI